MLGQPDSEQNRFKLGVLFLVIGLLLVLWAWGSWVFRVSADARDKAKHEAVIPIVQPPFVRGATFAIDPLILIAATIAGTDAESGGLSLLALTSMTVVLLLIVFLFGALAIVVGTRRWQTLAGRKRAPPTPNADVWAMHKVPEDYLEER